MSVPPDRTIAFHLNDKRVHFHLGNDGKTVTLDMALPSGGTLQLQIHPGRHTVLASELTPVLNGIVLRWEKKGVSVTLEEGTLTMLAGNPPALPGVTTPRSEQAQP